MTKIAFFFYSIKESVTQLFVHPRSQLFQALNFLVRPRERERGKIIFYSSCFLAGEISFYLGKMLGVFSSSIVSPPDELVAAGSRTPSPKITASALVNRFVGNNASAVSLHIGDHVQLAYTHHNESPWQPR